MTTLLTTCSRQSPSVREVSSLFLDWADILSLIRQSTIRYRGDQEGSQG